MDPITRASKQFLAEAEAFWRTGESSVLPMVAELSDRGELIKSLRLQELGPDNRRPLFLYEAPFVEDATYFDGFAAMVAKDYALLRAGIEEEGVSIPVLDARECAVAEPFDPLARAMLTVTLAATLLGDRFDGALVALVPSQVQDRRGWRESIDTLRRTRFSPRTRIGVFDPPSGPLVNVRGDLAARLVIDPDELNAYLRNLGSARSEGPPVAEAPAPTEDEKIALDAAGHRSPSPDVAQRLKAFLLDGAQQAAAGNAVLAATLYGKARRLCAGEGLVLEEALVLIALGGMCVGQGAVENAVASYRQAAVLAEDKEAWGVICQAWLGAGGAELTSKQYEPAAEAYRAAAVAAQRGEIAVLVLEARRLEGTCWLLAGEEDEAIAAWQDGLEIGAELRGHEREASTLAATVIAFSELLESRGLNEQAAHMRAVAHSTPAGEIGPSVLPVIGGDTLPFLGALPAADLPFVNGSVDPFSLGPSAGFSDEIGGETVELRVHAAGRGVTFTGSSGDTPPGKRVVRFDPQTGKPLPSPSWADMPPGPREDAETGDAAQAPSVVPSRDGSSGREG
jgi:hypothetical protein